MMSSSSTQKLDQRLRVATTLVLANAKILVIQEPLPMRSWIPVEKPAMLHEHPPENAFPEKRSTPPKAAAKMDQSALDSPGGVKARRVP